MKSNWVGEWLLQENSHPRSSRWQQYFFSLRDNVLNVTKLKSLKIIRQNWKIDFKGKRESKILKIENIFLEVCNKDTPTPVLISQGAALSWFHNICQHLKEETLWWAVPAWTSWYTRLLLKQKPHTRMRMFCAVDR